MRRGDWVTVMGHHKTSGLIVSREATKPFEQRSDTTPLGYNGITSGHRDRQDCEGPQAEASGGDRWDWAQLRTVRCWMSPAGRTRRRS